MRLNSPVAFSKEGYSVAFWRMHVADEQPPLLRFSHLYSQTRETVQLQDWIFPFIF
jgi:hypothetical protein